MPDAITGQTPRNRTLPKVWLLADRRGWAYDELCQGLKAAVAHEFDCRIAYVAEQPDLSAWEFDLVLVCFWGETWHQQFVANANQVIKLLCSHRWQEEGYGHLSPDTFAATHLRDAATLGATSKRLQELLAPCREVHHTPEGVDVERFANSMVKGAANRTADELTFGWVGNIDDSCKGVRDVLQPAAENFDLRIAKGDLDAAGMDAFYRDLDVIVVASSLEGQPRPLLEGMASGCFAISTDVGIAPELIQNGETGLLVERAPPAIRAAMHWCQVNAAYVRQQGQHNAAIMRRTRTWPTVAPAWLALLRDALEGLPSQAAPGAQPNRQPTLIDRCKQDYAVHLDAVHQEGPDQNSVAAAAMYYRNELLPLLPESRDVRVLDVGCAYGLLLEFLDGQGYHDLTGVEIDPALQRRAQARLQNRASIHHADANPWLAQHEGRFDVITAYDILEHFPLEDAARFATAICKALRPGGLAVFRTPNMANVLGIYSRFMDLTHQTGFTEQSASQLLRLSGFAGTELLVPDFSGEPQMACAVAESRRFHEQLFALQDRSMPRCFDKNLVIAARAPVAATNEPVHPAMTGAAQ